jgi:hypothetical protein
MTTAKYKFFSIIRTGELFDSISVVDGVTSINKAVNNIDGESTHKERDKVLIAKMKVYGEMLKAGMIDPRDAGRDMVEIAKEAQDMEDEIGFWWEG